MTRAGEFRPDIGALRAVAVMAVMLFHFGVPPFRGGFAGVDVFYVISGFLMTQIIERRVSGGRFSLIDFYWARVRRIVPALAALCLVLLVFGAVFIDPLTYEKQAAHALSSLTFLSNFQYMHDKGYFTGDARENWLLHTWSLSVEWQFYMVYPVALMVIARWKALYRHIGLILALGALLSFALSVYLCGKSTVHLKWAFFLLPPRAWEMMAGGLVALYGSRLKLSPAAQIAMQAAGLMLITASVLLFDGDLPWPSYWAAAPVLGGGLVLLAWRPDARWTALPGVQPLGAWSYSIYLWHWPIVVALSYFAAPKGPLTIVAGIAASIAAGWLSYELVETRLRDRLFAPERWAPRLAGIGSLLVIGLVLGCAAEKTGGFEAQRAARAMRPVLADYRAATGDWTSEEVCADRKASEGGLRLCRFGDPAARDVLVIGDSHAEQLEPRYAALFPQARGRGVTFAARAGCPPLPRVERSAPGWGCVNFQKKAFRLAESGAYRRVVIVGSWQGYFDPEMTGRLDPRVCFPNTICRAFMGGRGVGPAADAAFQRLSDRMAELRAKGVDVVLVGPFPYGQDTDPRDAYRRVFEGGPAPASYSPAGFERYTAYTDSRLRQAAMRAGATYVDPVAAMCGPQICPMTNAGRFLYKERSHYRASQVQTPLFAFLDRYLLAQGPLQQAQ